MWGQGWGGKTSPACTMQTDRARKKWCRRWITADLLSGKIKIKSSEEMHFLNHLNYEMYAARGRELLLFVCPSVILAMCGDSFALTDSVTPVVAWFKCIWAVKRPCTLPDSLVGYLPPDRMSTRSSQQQHHYCVRKANSVSLPSPTSWCQLMVGESRQPLKWVMKHPGRERGSQSGTRGAASLPILHLSYLFNWK